MKIFYSTITKIITKKLDMTDSRISRLLVFSKPQMNRFFEWQTNQHNKQIFKNFLIGVIIWNFLNGFSIYYIIENSYFCI